MMTKLPPHHDDPRRSRADGAQSRERLLLAAMRLFAEQGYARTSTREIALAASTNVASIAYYFGDKAGLYRAAFSSEVTCSANDVRTVGDPDAPLRDVLRAFYTIMLDQLKQGDRARLCMRLWWREMLEPTGLWDEKIDNGIKPAHAELVTILSRHLGVSEPGDDVRRLAFNVVGLAMQLMVTRDVIDSISPQLLSTPEGVDIWIERIAEYGEAMVNVERVRLADAGGAASPAAPIKKTTRKKTA